MTLDRVILFLGLAALLAVSAPAEAAPCQGSVIFTNLSASADYDANVTVQVSGFLTGGATRVRIFVSVSNGTGSGGFFVRTVNATAWGGFSETFVFPNQPAGSRAVSASLSPQRSDGAPCGSTVHLFTSVNVPAPLSLGLVCYGGIDEPEYNCFAHPDGGSGNYQVIWDTSGIDDIDEVFIDGDEINIFVLSCSPWDVVEVTVRDTVTNRTVYDYEGLACENEE